VFLSNVGFSHETETSSVEKLYIVLLNCLIKACFSSDRIWFLLSDKKCLEYIVHWGDNLQFSPIFALFELGGGEEM